MPLILSAWEVLITNTLYPSVSNLLALTDEYSQLLVYKSEMERETVRTQIIVNIVDKPEIKDKEQFIKLNQALLTRLLDTLFSYNELVKDNEKLSRLYDKISTHLESTIIFIQEFFSNYFDQSQKVPVRYLAKAVKVLCEQSATLEEKLLSKEYLDSALFSAIINNFKRFCIRHNVDLTYRELLYQQQLMKELLLDENLESEYAIREVLFYLNFNNEEYIDYLFELFKGIAMSLESKKEVIAALRFEQKRMNQLTSKLDVFFSSFTLSLREQVNNWIDQEVAFLEMTQSLGPIVKANHETEEKINFSLSVAKLALLIRLMVIDKTITNRVVAQVLRITVRMVGTVQTESISFGSLETKYHSPDKGTISAVREILFRWINILGKL